MKAYKTYVTIQDPQQVVLSNVPFRVGQKVEVLVLLTEDDTAARVQELKELLKTTQTLPQAQSLTDEDIAREIEAYRGGR